MPPARVQFKNSGAINSSTTSRSVTFDSAPTQGNLLIATAGINNPPAGLAISGAGWVELPSSPVAWSTTRELRAWYKIAGAGESATITVTTTAARNISLGIVEVSGIDQSNPLDVDRSNQSGATSIYTGITNDPAYSGGYKFSSLCYGNVTVRATEFLHGAALMGAEFLNGAAVLMRMFDKVETDDTPSDLSITSGNTNMRGVGITAIFKADGASTAGSHAPGGGTATPNAIVAGAGGAPTLTFSHSPSAGKLLVAIIKQNGLPAGTITAPTGWVQAGSYMDYDRDSAFSGQEIRTSIWYKESDGTEGPNIAFTVSTGSIAGALLNYSAPTTLDLTPIQHPHQVDETNVTTGSGPVHVGTSKVDGVTGSGLALAIFISNGTTGAIDTSNTPTNGWTKHGVVTGGNILVFYLPYSAAGKLSCAVLLPEPGSSATLSDVVGYLVTFAGPSGADHWAWAEQDLDSWQVVD